MHSVQWSDLFGSMDRFLVQMADAYGPLFYVVLGVIFFLETGMVFMAFLPGDSLLFVAGAVASGGRYRLDVLVLALVIGTVLGNLLNFGLGAWLGRKVFDGRVSWIDAKSVQTTHNFFEKHGGKTVVVALFAPLVRSFAPLVAGAMGMNQHKFRIYTVVGSVAWIGSFTGAGYLFGNLPLVRDHLGFVLVVGLIAALVGPIGVAALWRVFSGRFVRASRQKS
jgi:membrane-associated protein